MYEEMKNEVRDIGDEKMAPAACMTMQPKQSETLYQMSSRKSVNAKSLFGNSVTFTTSVDVSSVDQQYAKLKQFLHEVPESQKSDLLALLFPVFVHCFLILMKNGLKAFAQKFYSKYHKPFVEKDMFKEVIEGLASVQTAEDVLSNQALSQMQSHKYIVRMDINKGSFDLLMNFLSKAECPIIARILNSHVHIQDRHISGTSHDDSTLDESSDCDSYFRCTDPEGLANMLSTIEKLDALPPPLPSICLYSLDVGDNSPITCVTASENASLLCAGCDDSSLLLLTLEPTNTLPNLTEDAKAGVSGVRLFCDDSALPSHVNPDANHNSMDEPQTTTRRYLRGHSGPIYDCCFAYKDDLLLSCSADKSVRLWDVNQCQNVVCYQGHSLPVFCVASSLCNSYFVSGSMDMSARLWCYDRIYPLRTFRAHTASVDSVTFHPNGNYVVTGSADRTIRMFTTQDGSVVRLFSGHKSTVYCVACSPDGRLLASSGDDRRIRIWDIASQRQLAELHLHNDTVYTMSFTPDSKLLISGGSDGLLCVWNLSQNVTTEPETLVQLKTEPTEDLKRRLGHQMYCIQRSS